MSSIHSASRESLVTSQDVKVLESVAQYYVPIGSKQNHGFSGMNQITPKIRGLSLNPNADEFVPAALRLGSSSSENLLASKFSKDALGNCSLEKTSSNLKGSADERQQDWRPQLPDELITDFDIASDLLEDKASYEQSYDGFMASSGDNGGVLGLESAYYAGQDVGADQGAQQSLAMQDGLLFRNDGLTTAPITAASFVPLNAVNASLYGLGSQQSLSAEQPLITQKDAQFLWGVDADVDYETGSVLQQQTYNDLGNMQSLRLLAFEFPNFAVESLAEIYYANQCDLVLTVEMLTQLELQEEGCAQPHLQPPTTSVPSLSAMDFPALSGFELEDLSHSGGANLQSSSRQKHVELSNAFSHTLGRRVSGADFATIVRKHAGQPAANRPYERNGGSNLSLKSVRANASGRGAVEQAIIRDLELSQRQPWLETGDTVGSMYSDMREEARDHARIRNVYFEQARQAYLVGNKALAKDLSAKGQWHNEQMKVAHSKAGEAIFRQRNMPAAFTNSVSQGQPKLIDLHGLHVNEAMLLLKRELAALKVMARTVSGRQQVFICVGTGHHTKGSRTPARLPAAIERYLIEDEHLQFTETQPGMLRVII